MDPHPPGGSLNKKSYQDVQPERPSPINFCHPLFPQHMLFSQPPYAVNFPLEQFPRYPPYAQNFQYAAVPPPYPPYSVTPPAGAMPSPCLPARVMPSTALSDQGIPHLATGPGEQDADDAKPERTSRRLPWTQKEDIRLISSWLINFKKTDKYWEKLAAEYNSTTPRTRRRELKQLKNRWYNMMNRVAHFNECWCRVKAKYPSDQSESMQQMDKTWLLYNEEARVMYLEEAKHIFTFDHCWKAVWDQPKWKDYISSLFTRRTIRSEAGDYISSSEDSEGMPGKEIGQEGYITSKEGKDNVSSSSSEIQEDILCLVDPPNMLTKDHEASTEAQLYLSNQKLELASSKPGTRDKDTAPSMNQTELLMEDALQSNEFHHGRDQLMADTSKFHERQQEMLPRDDMLDKESQQGFESLEHERVAMENIPKREKQPEGCKTQNSSRKRKGNAASSSFEVQEDIKQAVYLQTMLYKDREKISEVQLRLSKDMIELAKIKQEEAKEKKETTLYKKYTELLVADTSKFDEFQKAEYERAVKHIGGILFSRDGN